MKKYLIIGGVLVLIVGGVWIYSAQKGKSQVANSTDTVSDQGFSVSQNGKTISAQYVSDTSNLNLGLAVYPKAKLIEEKGAAENITIGKSKIMAATYSTSDARGKVEQYYKNQIGSEAITVEAIDGSATYRVIKSKTNIGPFVNVWVEGSSTLFTVIKPV